MVNGPPAILSLRLLLVMTDLQEHVMFREIGNSFIMCETSQKRRQRAHHLVGTPHPLLLLLTYVANSLALCTLWYVYWPFVHWRSVAQSSHGDALNSFIDRR